jgi:hypothetical protein
MQKRFTDEELLEYVDVSLDAPEFVPTIIGELAAELLRVQSLKGSFVERGYNINKLQMELNKVRKAKAFKAKQIDILLRETFSKTDFEISATVLAETHNDPDYLEAGKAINSLRNRRLERAKMAAQATKAVVLPTTPPGCVSAMPVEARVLTTPAQAPLKTDLSLVQSGACGVEISAAVKSRLQLVSEDK